MRPYVGITQIRYPGLSTMNLITLCWRCHNAAHGGQMVTDYPGGTPEQVQEDLELACVEYVSDYYAERGEVWYPWDG